MPVTWLSACIITYTHRTHYFTSRPYTHFILSCQKSEYTVVMCHNNREYNTKIKMFFCFSISALPVDQFNKCKNIAAVVTARGGHIGFMEGFLPSSYRGKDDYMDRIVCQYFSAIFRDGGKIMAKLDG